MWISKKKFGELEKRIADLEGQVQSQQINKEKELFKALDQLKIKYQFHA
ncbi:hypothetical protein [Anaerocolumna sp.]|nr:hypothetical protein [Anaerocolumna sp.]